MLAAHRTEQTLHRHDTYRRSTLNSQTNPETSNKSITRSLHCETRDYINVDLRLHFIHVDIRYVTPVFLVIPTHQHVHMFFRLVLQNRRAYFPSLYKFLVITVLVVSSFSVFSLASMSIVLLLLPTYDLIVHLYTIPNPLSFHSTPRPAGQQRAHNGQRSSEISCDNYTQFYRTIKNNNANKNVDSFLVQFLRHGSQVSGVRLHTRRIIETSY